MAKKKASFSEWKEPTDEATVEAEVTGNGDEAPAEAPTVEPTIGPTVEPTTVNLTEPKPKKGPEVSETTKAEQEAGKKVLEENSKPPA